MPLVKDSAILFDLDGTLVDTAPDLAGTMNDLLAKLGLAPLDVAAVRGMVGHGARALMAHGLKHHGRTTSEAELDQLVTAFIDIYATRIAKDSKPFPGAAMVLDLLIASGAHLGVVTNKPEGLTRLLLDAVDMIGRFGAIVGYDTAPRPKPHADPILLACERLKVPLGRAVMVGDSSTDVAAARAAGIPVIAMRHGYSNVPADELGADLVVGGFGELAGALERALALR